MASDVHNLAETERIELFMRVFVNRTDIFALQYVHGEQHGYRAIRAHLDRDVVMRHLRGEQTLGIHALSESSTAKWLAVDVDSTDICELQRGLDHGKRLGLPAPLIEFSGRRGYHFWWFFKEAVPGWQARRLGMAITRAHEVFPKQGNASRDTSRPGSLIKAPLGIHQVSRQRSCFLKRDFEHILDPWAALENIEKVDLGKFLPLIGQDSPKETASSSSYALPRRIRPCIENALRDGAKQGQRNEVGHIIACEERRLGRPKQETVGVLACWNLRNEPRLSQYELRLILESAYSGKNYTYSCSSAGHLRRVLACPGGQTCRYWCRRCGSRSQKQGKEGSTL